MAILLVNGNTMGTVEPTSEDLIEMMHAKRECNSCKSWHWDHGCAKYSYPRGIGINKCLTIILDPKYSEYEFGFERDRYPNGR